MSENIDNPPKKRVGRPKKANPGKARLIGNAVNRSKLPPSMNMLKRLTVCDIDIQIEHGKSYTVFDKEVMGRDLVDMDFSHVVHRIDAIIMRMFIKNFHMVPHLFHEEIYSDILKNQETSIFYHKDPYELKLAYKKWQKKKEVNVEFDYMRMPKVEMTPSIAKKRNDVINYLMRGDSRVNRRIANAYVDEIVRESETRIYNLKPKEIFQAILEKNGFA